MTPRVDMSKLRLRAPDGSVLEYKIHKKCNSGLIYQAFEKLARGGKDEAITGLTPQEVRYIAAVLGDLKKRFDEHEASKTKVNTEETQQVENKATEE